MNDPDSSIPADADARSKSDLLQPDPVKPVSQSITAKEFSDAGKPSRGMNGLPSNWLTRLLGLAPVDSAKARDELADAVEENAQAAGFSSGEKEMLNNVLALQDVRVEDVMTPRAEMEAVDGETMLGELLHMFEESGHSRMPVYAETLDDPKGMVHIRDVLAHITKTAHLPKNERATRKRLPPANLDFKRVAFSKSLFELKLVREVLFVPPSMHAADLMTRMQATRIQMALVIDEYGGTDGLVSLEDLLEMVVGDIEDEHDVDEEILITETSEGVYLCDARAELEDVAEMVANGFSGGELAEEVDTVGGLVFALIDRIPVRGEVIEALGYEFRVIDADPRRIRKIELSKAKRHTK